MENRDMATRTTTRPRLLLTLGVAGSLWASAAAHAGTPRPLGGALQLLRPEGAVVPGDSLFSQDAPTVVAAPGGGFVVAWHQWDNFGHRLLARSISNRAEVGAGLEIRRLYDERDEPSNLKLGRTSTGVVAVWNQFFLHVGSFVEAQLIMGGDGVLGKTGELLSIRSGGNCLQVSGFGNTAQIFWQLAFGGPAPVVVHGSVLMAPGQLVYMPTTGLIPLSREWLARSELTCSAFDGGSRTWWTFATEPPTLHYRNLDLGREFRLTDLEAPVSLHAIQDGGRLLVARKGSELRVYRADLARDSLAFRGRSSAGDRALAAAPDGRLVVARRTADGLQIRFLDADLQVEGEAITLPSVDATAAFDDSGRQVLLAWTAENSVTRPNGGHVVPVAVRVFEWVVP
jgi:hypothetical protein